MSSGRDAVSTMVKGQTFGAPGAENQVCNSGQTGKAVQAMLEPAARRRLIRLALVSLVVVLCSLVVRSVAPLIVFCYFAYLKCRLRVDTADLIVLWLVSVPFLGPYSVVQVGGGLPDIQFNRLFGMLLLYSAISEGTPRNWFANGLDLFLAVFIVACLLSIPGSLMIRTPLRLLLDAMLIPCVFYFASKRCIVRQDFLPKLFLGAWLALLTVGALGIVEGFTGRDILRYEDELTHAEDTDDFRVNGPFPTAEHYGSILIMLLLFVTMMQGLRRSGLVRPRSVQAARLFGIGGIACTVTRGIWLSFLAGWLVVRLRRRPFFYLTLTVLGVGSWLVLQESVLPSLFGDLWQRRVAHKKTVYARIATYQSAMVMFKDHPLTGVGFGSFSEAYDRFPNRYLLTYKEEESVSTPHNLFFAVLSQTGLLGFIAFLLFQIHVFAKSIRLARWPLQDARQNYGDAMLAIAGAFVIVGLSLDFTSNTGFVTKIYFLFLGALSGFTTMAPEASSQLAEAVQGAPNSFEAGACAGVSAVVKQRA